MIENLPIESLRAAFSTSVIARLAGSVAVVIVLYAVHRMVFQVITRRVEAPDKQLVLQQTSKYVAVVIGVLLLGPLWVEHITPIFAVLSLVAAALTIVNKELILNLTAWPVIHWRGLFTPGDRVQVGTQVGDVVELGMLYFTLSEVGTGEAAEQPTGRITKVPNSAVLTQPVTNYCRTFNYVWHQISLTLTPESDWRAAEALVRDVARQHVPTIDAAAKRSKQRGGRAATGRDESPVVYTHVREGKRTVTLRYLCRPQRCAAFERTLWTALLTSFDGREDVKLALV